MLYSTYQVFNPPLTVAFEDMKPRQAQEYLDWFLSVIPQRLNKLRLLLDATTSSSSLLDFTCESLLPLGTWFNTQVDERWLDSDELAAEQANLPRWFWPLITGKVLTDRTISLCVDIAIYFAEILRQLNPALQWDFIRKPKNDADFHRPVLICPAYCVPLNPVRIVCVVAYKIIDGKKAEQELTEVFQIWHQAMSNNP